MNYFGIDIGGTAVKYGIVSEQGKILCKGEYPVNFDQYETPILQTVLDTSIDFLNMNGYTYNELLGIGISATGQIDTKKGKVIGIGGNIKNWEGAELKKSLEDQFGLPVTVVNDANCVAIGEQWIGAARDCKNVIVITIGTGLGGGIIVNGEVLLGTVGIAGELGHFSIDKNGLLCTCGNKGCYEQYASMTALIKSVKNAVAEGENPFDEQEINGRTIFALLEKENLMICELVDKWITDISIGLISLTHIFNPEKIIIGGGISVQRELFVNKVRNKVLENTMNNFGKTLNVEGANLGNDAGLVGAVRYLMSYLEI